MKSLGLVILFLFAISSSASECDSIVKDRYLGLTYHQKAYQLDDPQGDWFLMNDVSEIPKMGWYKLTGQYSNRHMDRWKEHQKRIVEHPEYAYEEDHINIRLNDLPVDPRQSVGASHIAPIVAERLALSLKNVITAQAQSLSGLSLQSPVHRWNSQCTSSFRKDFSIFRFSPMMPSKILMALFRGVTYRYLKTGKEELWLNEVFQRKDFSVTVHEAFQISLRLNQGDIYLSLLTVENVLARYWNDPERYRRKVMTKLSSVTNDGPRSDKYGAWYHLFGSMLYSYVKGESLGSRVVQIENMLGRVGNRLKAEPQEEMINEIGVYVGASLRGFISNRDYTQFKVRRQYERESFYRKFF